MLKWGGAFLFLYLAIYLISLIVIVLGHLSSWSCNVKWKNLSVSHFIIVSKGLIVLLSMALHTWIIFVNTSILTGTLQNNRFALIVLYSLQALVLFIGTWRVLLSDASYVQTLRYWVSMSVLNT